MSPNVWTTSPTPSWERTSGPHGHIPPVLGPSALRPCAPALGPALPLRHFPLRSSAPGVVLCAPTADGGLQRPPPSTRTVPRAQSGRGGHQVGGVSHSPDGLFAQQEEEPIEGRPAVRGKGTYGGRPGQRVEEQGTWASLTQRHSEAGYGRLVDRGVCGQQKQSNDPRNNQHNPQYANYWAPLTRKRHIPPHSAQPRHTSDRAPRTRKRHQQEHRPQRPTERSAPTQHAKGRTGDCPGPRKGATTRRNVTRGVGGHAAPGA